VDEDFPAGLLMGRHWKFVFPEIWDNKSTRESADLCQGWFAPDLCAFNPASLKLVSFYCY